MLKKALIIGASHFLGAHLAKRLIRLGFKVTALVDVNDKIWRLMDVLDVLEIKRADFFAPQELCKIVSQYTPGYIFYVSSYGEKEHQTNKKMIQYFNFTLMKEIFDELSETGFETFIYIGSYLEQLALNTPNPNHAAATTNCSHTTKECYPPNILEYGSAKNLATKYLAKEAISCGLPIYSIRPYFTYGPYFSCRTAFGKLMLNAGLRNRLELNHEFINRDFVHVRDFVNFAVAITMLKPRNKVIFDCGSGFTVSAQDIVNTLAAYLPKLNLKLVDYSQCYCANYLNLAPADIAINKEVVPSWEPTITLDFGIKDIVGWVTRNTILYREFFQEEADKDNKFYFPWML